MQGTQVRVNVQLHFATQVIQPMLANAVSCCTFDKVHVSYTYTAATSVGSPACGRVNRLHQSSEYLTLLRMLLGCQAGVFVGHQVANAAGAGAGAASVGDAGHVAHAQHLAL
jgi:hypothetical protein